jgi:hypothetical protein
MIPKHVLDVLNTLTPAQKQKFQELCMWAGHSGMKGSVLPINYDQLLDMVKQMGPDPVVPVEPPPVVDHELLDRIKKLKGIE